MCIGYTGVIIGGNSLAGDTCIAPEASLLGVMSGPSREFAQLYMYCSGPDVAALNTLAQSSNTLVSVCLSQMEICCCRPITLYYMY